MSDDERRRFPRLNVPVLYRPARLLSSRQPAQDLGLGGIRVLTDDSLAVGTRLEIELFLPEGASLTVEVRVAWLRDSDNGARYEAGLAFMEMDDDERAQLARYIAARGS